MLALLNRIGRAFRRFITRVRHLFRTPPVRKLGGYCPVWGSPLSYRLRQLNGVNVVYLAFGFPEYDNSVGWGPQNDPPREAVVEAIDELHVRRIPVLLSIGGDNCTRHDWENITDPVEFARSVRRFVDEWHLAGIELDYQIHEHDHSPVIPILQELRKALPAGKYLLTYSGWHHISSEERVLKELGSALDWVNARCYLMNSYPEYDPEQMILSYKKALREAQKVVFGFRIASHRGEPEMTPEDAARFSRFAVNENLGGVNFWHLSDLRIPEFTATVDRILFPDPDSPRWLPRLKKYSRR